MVHHNFDEDRMSLPLLLAIDRAAHQNYHEGNHRCDNHKHTHCVPFWRLTLLAAMLVDFVPRWLTSRTEGTIVPFSAVACWVVSLFSVVDHQSETRFFHLAGHESVSDFTLAPISLLRSNLIATLTDGHISWAYHAFFMLTFVGLDEQIGVLHTFLADKVFFPLKLCFSNLALLDVEEKLLGVVILAKCVDGPLLCSGGHVDILSSWLRRDLHATDIINSIG